MNTLAIKRSRFSPSNRASRLKLQRFHSPSQTDSIDWENDNGTLAIVPVMVLALCLASQVLALTPLLEVALSTLVFTLEHHSQSEGLFGAMMLVITLTYLLSGMIKGLAGIGMGLIAVPVVSEFYGPVTAIALVSVPLIMTNFWQGVVASQNTSALITYSPLVVSMTITMVICSYYSSLLPTTLFSFLLGFMAILFALINFGIGRINLRGGKNYKVQLGVGVIAGITGGLTGLVVIPLVFYMMCSDIKKDEFVSTLGLLLLISGLALFAGYTLNEHMTGELLIFSCIAVIPALLGVIVGEKLRKKINEQAFRKLVLWLVFAIGAKILITELLGSIS